MVDSGMDPVAVLQSMGMGHFLEDLVDALASVGNEVAATGTPGSVAIGIRVAPAQGMDRGVVMNETIRRTIPPKKSRGALFVAIDGGLFREDPRQAKLEFRTLPDSEGQVRAPSDEGAVIRREA